MHSRYHREGRLQSPLIVLFAGQTTAVVALALLESVSAFQELVLKASAKAVGATMFSEGDLCVLKAQRRPLSLLPPLSPLLLLLLQPLPLLLLLPSQPLSLQH